MHSLSRNIPKTDPVTLAGALVKNIVASGYPPIISAISASGVYINFTLTMQYLGRITDMIVGDGSFLSQLSSQGRDRVMIEYSQRKYFFCFCLYCINLMCIFSCSFYLICIYYQK